MFKNRLIFLLSCLILCGLVIVALAVWERRLELDRDLAATPNRPFASLHDIIRDLRDARRKLLAGPPATDEAVDVLLALSKVDRDLPCDLLPDFRHEFTGVSTSQSVDGVHTVRAFDVTRQTLLLHAPHETLAKVRTAILQGIADHGEGDWQTARGAESIASDISCLVYFHRRLAWDVEGRDIQVNVLMEMHSVLPAKRWTETRQLKFSMMLGETSCEVAGVTDPAGEVYLTMTNIRPFLKAIVSEIESLLSRKAPPRSGRCAPGKHGETV